MTIQFSITVVQDGTESTTPLVDLDSEVAGLYVERLNSAIGAARATKVASGLEAFNNQALVEAVSPPVVEEELGMNTYEQEVYHEEHGK